MPTLTEESPAKPPSRGNGPSTALGVAFPSVVHGRLAENLAFISLAVLILYATLRNICNTLVKPMPV